MKKIKKIVIKILIVIIVMNLSYVVINNIRTIINLNEKITTFSLSVEEEEKLKAINENIERIDDLQFANYESEDAQSIKALLRQMQDKLNKKVSVLDEEKQISKKEYYEAMYIYGVGDNEPKKIFNILKKYVSDKNTNYIFALQSNDWIINFIKVDGLLHSDSERTDLRMDLEHYIFEMEINSMYELTNYILEIGSEK